MYSTIQKKHCKCKACKELVDNDEADKAKWPSYGCDGKNYNCLSDEEKQIIGTRNKLAQKKRAYNNAQSRMLHIAQKEADGHTWQVELFFAGAAVELSKNPYCQECGEWIPPNLYRAATAHILPKRKEYGFPSVAAHPKNRLFLCGINGCHGKTHTWSTFQKMKVWGLAVEAFKVIYPYIDSAELKNIPNVLLKTLLPPVQTFVGNSENNQNGKNYE